MHAYTQVGAITSRTVTRACKGIRVLNGLPSMLLTATLGGMHAYACIFTRLTLQTHTRTIELLRMLTVHELLHSQIRSIRRHTSDLF